MLSLFQNIVGVTLQTFIYLFIFLTVEIPSVSTVRTFVWSPDHSGPAMFHQHPTVAPKIITCFLKMLQSKLAVFISYVFA